MIKLEEAQEKILELENKVLMMRRESDTKKDQLEHAESQMTEYRTKYEQLERDTQEQAIKNQDEIHRKVKEVTEL